MMKMIKEIKVVKMRNGVKVVDEILGNVQVSDNRISAKVYEKFSKIIYKSYRVGKNEYLKMYIEEKEVLPPTPFVDTARIED